MSPHVLVVVQICMITIVLNSIALGIFQKSTHTLNEPTVILLTWFVGHVSLITIRCNIKLAFQGLWFLWVPVPVLWEKILFYYRPSKTRHLIWNFWLCHPRWQTYLISSFKHFTFSSSVYDILIIDLLHDIHKTCIAKAQYSEDSSV